MFNWQLSDTWLAVEWQELLTVAEFQFHFLSLDLRFAAQNFCTFWCNFSDEDLKQFGRVCVCGMNLCEKRKNRNKRQEVYKISSRRACHSKEEKKCEEAAQRTIAISRKSGKRRKSWPERKISSIAQVVAYCERLLDKMAQNRVHNSSSSPQ